MAVFKSGSIKLDSVIGSGTHDNQFIGVYNVTIVAMGEASQYVMINDSREFFTVSLKISISITTPLKNPTKSFDQMISGHSVSESRRNLSSNTTPNGLGMPYIGCNSR